MQHVYTSTYSIQDIRSLDKEMRAWDAFTGLDSTVKNMVTSLRAVGELQNPAIRERHWQQLMQATQVCQYRMCVHEKNVKLGQLLCGGSLGVSLINPIILAC